MFNKEKIERLERNVKLLETQYQGSLKIERDIKYLEARACSLLDIQNRILDNLNLELKTTSSKTELVAKEMQDKKACVPEEDIIVEEIKLDKRENCKTCPKCGSKEIQTMWDCEKNILEKSCECSYGWNEDCLFEDYVKKLGSFMAASKINK